MASSNDRERSLVASSAYECATGRELAHAGASTRALRAFDQRTDARELSIRTG
jgi:hypothetical protein